MFDLVTILGFVCLFLLAVLFLLFALYLRAISKVSVYKDTLYYRSISDPYKDIPWYKIWID